MKYFKLLVITLLLTTSALAQNRQTFGDDDDLKIGSDIFNDFNEDLEAAQVMEDERFYRYSRFFGVNLGLGYTTFTGNRGVAYSDNHPSFSLSVMYFINFQNAFVMGFSFSKHTMLIDTFVNSNRTEITGAVVTSMLRPFFGFRYYIDTSDLGTAITYSNPYLIGRIEYWYQTNTFPESENLETEAGGGLGTGIGFGLEFPIELKKTYWNVEFLYHAVNFFDKFTQNYREVDEPKPNFESEYGFDDLNGDVLTIFINYHISW